MSAMAQAIAIGAAGAAGVLARYFMIAGIARALGHGFPYGTVLINLLGSFLIGVVYVLGFERSALDEITRVALMTGLLGGFTTYSSFALETARLFELGQWSLAAANVTASLALGLAAVFAGLALARAVV